ncbi:lysozyme inhibitor LprI family protein [Pseudoduganella sp. UC29_106]|uniref:lysozyme inhibitor LprI family protein n=1 Tax=Pseudoduganella sp. UC29_106 TaxID=3374553 RepID=UPI003756740D
MRLAGLLVCLLSLGPACAQDVAECKPYERLQYPAADQPSGPQAASLAKCSADSHYYGIGSPVDYAKARLCAFVAEDAPYQPSKGVLMMVYANGLGVPRNYGLAKKAACETFAAQAETEARLQHLERMQLGKAGPAPKIDLCDDITSGEMGGYCASVHSSLATQERERVSAALTAKWNAESREAFGRLRAKADGFIEARGGEVDRSGSARVAFVVEEQDRQRADLLKSLREFEAGKLPGMSREEFATADREMNVVYQQLKRSRDPGFPGAVKMVDILQAQRAWLAYRDEWVRFGKVRYPAVADFAWEGYFTRKRTGMLRELLIGRR